MAQETALPSGTVTALIDRLLKEKDPAAVGLRRILKTKQEQGSAFPCRSMVFTEFDRPDQGQKVFSADERRIMELERELLDLRSRLDQSKAVADKAIRAAFEEGRKSGMAKGEDVGSMRAHALSDKKLTELQDRTTGVIQALADSKKRLFTDAEHLLIKLSRRMAERIIRTELTQNSEVIIATVKKALNFIADREKMVIRVNPADYQMVTDKRDFWMPINERLKDVVIEKDERIARGGCMVESPGGLVDARIESQLEELGDLIEKTWLSVSNPYHAETDPARIT